MIPCLCSSASIASYRRLLKLLPALGAALLALGLVTGCVTSNSVVNLSHYDPASPDFAGMRAEHVVGVIHEATYPPATGDPKYPERAASAARAGLLWGAYHFGNGSDPVRQADEFLDYVGRYRALGAGVLLVLDFEQNTHYPGGSMSVAQAAAFARRVRERTGKFPGIYGSQNRLRAMLGSSAADAVSRRTLRECWLWIANYHYRPGAVSPWSGWKLWQYTGDGICDLPRREYPIRVANVAPAERNIFRGSEGDVRNFWREHAW